MQSQEQEVLELEETDREQNLAINATKKGTFLESVQELRRRWSLRKNLSKAGLSGEVSATALVDQYAEEKQLLLPKRANPSREETEVKVNTVQADQFEESEILHLATMTEVNRWRKDLGYVYSP